MIDTGTLLLVLDLLGTFAFGLNGALTAMRAVRLDLLGVVTLGIITAVGGGIIRDLVIGAVPPVTFRDWRYLAVALAGALVAFVVGHRLGRLNRAIQALDAVGLGLFAVTGAAKAMGAGLGPLPSVLLGGVTAVGGGVLRDVMLRRVPAVLTSGLYATPALLGAAMTVAAVLLGWYGPMAAVVAAGSCIALRVVGALLKWQVPRPRSAG